MCVYVWVSALDSFKLCVFFRYHLIAENLFLHKFAIKQRKDCESSYPILGLIRTVSSCLHAKALKNVLHYVAIEASALVFWF